MGLLSNRHARTVGRIINMTDKPIHLYDDSTGDVVPFFPSMMRFRRERPEGLFPRAACYVFEREAIGDINWFLRKYGNVAVIIGRGLGYGGAEIVTLRAADDGECVRFRSRRWGPSSL